MGKEEIFFLNDRRTGQHSGSGGNNVCLIMHLRGIIGDYKPFDWQHLSWRPMKALLRTYNSLSPVRRKIGGSRQTGLTEDIGDNEVGMDKSRRGQDSLGPSKGRDRWGRNQALHRAEQSSAEALSLAGTVSWGWVGSGSVRPGVGRPPVRPTLAESSRTAAARPASCLFSHTHRSVPRAVPPFPCRRRLCKTSVVSAHHRRRRGGKAPATRHLATG